MFFELLIQFRFHKLLIIAFIGSIKDIVISLIIQRFIVVQLKPMKTKKILGDNLMASWLKGEGYYCSCYMLLGYYTNFSFIALLTASVCECTCSFS